MGIIYYVCASFRGCAIYLIPFQKKGLTCIAIKKEKKFQRDEKNQGENAGNECVYVIICNSNTVEMRYTRKQ